MESPSPRYRKHRQQAAVRRRRIALTIVALLALGVVGGAMAFPRGDDPAPSAAITKIKQKKKQAPPVEKGTVSAKTTDAGVTVEAEQPVDGIWPDWKPTPQAQRAIDTALAHGRPPQFVIASFDGAADLRQYQRWIGLGDEIGARFTFFVSGIYMLYPENKDLYQPPQASLGFSSLGGYAELAGEKSPKENLRDIYAQFALAHAKGYEIGTHYVSHICEPSDQWSTEDWISEQSQWESLILNASENNHISPALPVNFSRSDFHGGRTPCLMGNKANVFAMLKQMGYVYDSSETGPLTGWPQKKQGIWSFPLQLIDRVGSPYPTLAMDFNFYINQSDAKQVDEASAREFEDLTYRSYLNAFNTVYAGNRAPFGIGTHFANWNRSAYTNALERTLRVACTKPEVACVTYITLVHWLEQQSPAQRRQWEAGDFAKRSGG